MNKKFLSEHWVLLVGILATIALTIYHVSVADYSHAFSTFGLMIWMLLVLFQQHQIMTQQQQLKETKALLTVAHEALNMAKDVIIALNDELYQLKK